MSIFRTRGFDSIIGKGMEINGANLALNPNSTLVVEGTVTLASIKVQNVAEGKVDKKTTLRVSGHLTSEQAISIQNVIITGTVVCNEIRVEGTLAIKAGAALKAKKILYRELIVESGAIMHGEMFHLDHVSEGESI
jgi:cytoskeletal protein CcmA (bactofilin family)